VSRPEPDRQLEEFLRRAKAEQKSSTLRDRADRLLHESVLRRLLASLSIDGFRVEEALAPVSRRPGEQALAPDFFVQKEDVLLDVYLVLNQPPATVARDFVRQLSDALNSNAALNAVVLVWPDSEYPAVVLDAFLIRTYLDDHTDPVPIRLAPSPVVAAVKAFYYAQFLSWQIPEGLFSRIRPRGGADLEGAIRRLFARRVQEERGRRYEIPAKVRARDAVVARSFEAFVSYLLDALSRGSLDDETTDTLVQLIEQATSSHD
jgi:hypothetical protein